MGVVMWSAYFPSTPTIRVRIPLKPTVFSVKCVFETNENKQKRPVLAHFLKKKKTHTLEQLIPGQKSRLRQFLFSINIYGKDEKRKRGQEWPIKNKFSVPLTLHYWRDSIDSSFNSDRFSITICCLCKTEDK